VALNLLTATLEHVKVYITDTTTVRDASYKLNVAAEAGSGG